MSQVAEDRRILIVEDEEGIALHLQFILKRLGYITVDAVASGEKAIERAGVLKPDLVLMDIYLLGHMNGIEAAREIRSRFNIPCIFLTALASDDIIRQAQFSDPYAYLVKPIQERELHAAIDLAIYKHQIENRLRESEERYRLLFEKMADGLVLYEFDTDEQGQPAHFRFLTVNPAFEKMTGASADHLIGKELLEILPDFDPFIIQEFQKVAQTGQSCNFLRYMKSLNRYYNISAYLSRLNQLAVLISDVTERIMAEKAIEESEIRFRQLAEGVREVFWLRNKDNGAMLYISPAYERVWGRPCQELYENSRSFLENVHPDDKGRVTRAHNALQEMGLPFNEEYRIVRPDGEVRWVWARTYPVFEKNGEVIRYSGIAEDVTERKQSEQELIKSYRAAETHLLRMTVLRNIDQAITTHTDLTTMVGAVLKSIISISEVHAALLFFPQKSQQAAAGGLTLAGSAGLDQKALSNSIMNWLKQEAFHVLEGRVPFHISHLQSQPHLGAIQLSLEHASSGCSLLPLQIKGQVKGVLVLLLRYSDCMEPGIIDFFESLAMQTSIAIDNVEMFQGLKRSHTELSKAYDATIRGWAQALELRDKETRGHSERVIQMSLKLGRQIGMTEEELVHFQRGVLLHDIGKMAVPDNVLLKPGPLTEDEWVLMRQHPVYAYEMLSQIDYLKPAINVPYCHHERWDGTGYPRGLKGNDIPREARIFAIIDAWDALTSGRPYRPSWSHQDALAYLTRQSGKHFDPEVVVAFLKMMADNEKQTV